MAASATSCFAITQPNRLKPVVQPLFGLECDESPLVGVSPLLSSFLAFRARLAPTQPKFYIHTHLASTLLIAHTFSSLIAQWVPLEIASRSLTQLPHESWRSLLVA